MIVRNLLNSKVEYDELLFPNSRSIELIDPWDICDWRIILPKYQEYWHYFYSGFTGRLLKTKITDEDKRKYISK